MNKTRKSDTKPADDTVLQLIGLVRELVELQKEQTKMAAEHAGIFKSLVGTWTQPVEIQPLPMTRDEQDVLDDLEDRAFAGDDEARQIMLDPDKLRSHMHQFKS